MKGNYAVKLVLIIIVNLSMWDHVAIASTDNKHATLLKETSMSIHRYYAEGDIKGLTQTVLTLNDRLSSNQVGDTFSNQITYYSALAHYRIGLVDYENAKTSLQSCIELTNKIIKAKEVFTEAYILKAACSNTLIGSLPEQTMELSLNARNAIKKASELEANNPRLLLIQATTAVYTPPQFGGGLEQASQLLTSAITQFEANKNGQQVLSTYWGLDEAYMWKGMLHSVNGKQKEAIVAMEKSLAIAESQWVQKTLLPTLQKGESIGRFFGL